MRRRAKRFVARKTNSTQYGPVSVEQLASL
jgi:hypothetical protein